ncbi:MAG: hypothetical protein ACRC4M_04930 [Mycoplasma sp.]
MKNKKYKKAIPLTIAAIASTFFLASTISLSTLNIVNSEKIDFFKKRKKSAIEDGEDNWLKQNDNNTKVFAQEVKLSGKSNPSDQDFYSSNPFEYFVVDKEYSEDKVSQFTKNSAVSFIQSEFQYIPFSYYNEVNDISTLKNQLPIPITEESYFQISSNKENDVYNKLPYSKSFNTKFLNENINNHKKEDLNGYISPEEYEFIDLNKNEFFVKKDQKGNSEFNQQNKQKKQPINEVAQWSSNMAQLYLKSWSTYGKEGTDGTKGTDGFEYTKQGLVHIEKWKKPDGTYNKDFAKKSFTISYPWLDTRVSYDVQNNEISNILNSLLAFNYDSTNSVEYTENTTVGSNNNSPLSTAFNNTSTELPIDTSSNFQSQDKNITMSVNPWLLYTMANMQNALQYYYQILDLPIGFRLGDNTKDTFILKKISRKESSNNEVYLELEKWNGEDLISPLSNFSKLQVSPTENPNIFTTGTSSISNFLPVPDNFFSPSGFYLKRDEGVSLTNLLYDKEKDNITENYANFLEKENVKKEDFLEKAFNTSFDDPNFVINKDLHRFLFITKTLILSGALTNFYETKAFTNEVIDKKFTGEVSWTNFKTPSAQTKTKNYFNPWKLNNVSSNSEGNFVFNTANTSGSGQDALTLKPAQWYRIGCHYNLPLDAMNKLMNVPPYYQLALNANVIPQNQFGTNPTTTPWSQPQLTPGASEHAYPIRISVPMNNVFNTILSLKDQKINRSLFPALTIPIQKNDEFNINTTPGYDTYERMFNLEQNFEENSTASWLTISHRKRKQSQNNDDYISTAQNNFNTNFNISTLVPDSKLPSFLTTGFALVGAGVQVDTGFNFIDNYDEFLKDTKLENSWDTMLSGKSVINWLPSATKNKLESTQLKLNSTRSSVNTGGFNDISSAIDLTEFQKIIEKIKEKYNKKDVVSGKAFDFKGIHLFSTQNRLSESSPTPLFIGNNDGGDSFNIKDFKWTPSFLDSEKESTPYNPETPFYFSNQISTLNSFASTLVFKNPTNSMSTPVPFQKENVEQLATIMYLREGTKSLDPKFLIYGDPSTKYEEFDYKPDDNFNKKSLFLSNNYNSLNRSLSNLNIENFTYDNVENLGLKPSGSGMSILPYENGSSITETLLKRGVFNKSTNNIKTPYWYLTDNDKSNDNDILVSKFLTKNKMSSTTQTDPIYQNRKNNTFLFMIDNVDFESVESNQQSPNWLSVFYKNISSGIEPLIYNLNERISNSPSDVSKFIKFRSVIFNFLNSLPSELLSKQTTLRELYLNNRFTLEGDTSLNNEFAIIQSKYAPLYALNSNLFPSHTNGQTKWSLRNLGFAEGAGDNKRLSFDYNYDLITGNNFSEDEMKKMVKIKSDELGTLSVFLKWNQLSNSTNTPPTQQENLFSLAKRLVIPEGNQSLDVRTDFPRDTHINNDFQVFSSSMPSKLNVENILSSNILLNSIDPFELTNDYNIKTNLTKIWLNTLVKHSSKYEDSLLDNSIYWNMVSENPSKAFAYNREDIENEPRQPGLAIAIQPNDKQKTLKIKLIIRNRDIAKIPPPIIPIMTVNEDGDPIIDYDSIITEPSDTETNSNLFGEDKYMYYNLTLNNVGSSITNPDDSITSGDDKDNNDKVVEITNIDTLKEMNLYLEQIELGYKEALEYSTLFDLNKVIYKLNKNQINFMSKNVKFINPEGGYFKLSNNVWEELISSIDATNTTFTVDEMTNEKVLNNFYLKFTTSISLKIKTVSKGTNNFETISSEVSEFEIFESFPNINWSVAEELETTWTTTSIILIVFSVLFGLSMLACFGKLYLKIHKKRNLNR